MPDEQSRTDLDYLKEQLRHLEDHYSALRSRWPDDQRYYDGEFEVSIPDGGNKVVPGTGRNAVDVPAQHIVTDKPLVKRRRDAHSARSKEDDDDVEKFLMAFLAENDEQAETPSLHEATKYQLLRGEAGLIGPFFSQGRWKRGDPDWLWYDAVDPVNLLLEPGPQPRQGFLRYDLTVAEMEQLAIRDKRFEAFDARNRRSTEVLTLVEWYGFARPRDAVCHYAAWEERAYDWIIPPKPSGYPYLPLDRVYSGFGIRSRGADPKQLSQSIFTKQVKDLLEDECYALSVASSVMGAATWERYSIPPGMPTDGIFLDYMPGSLSYIPETMRRIEPSVIPTAALEHLANVKRALEEALFSGVISGQRPAGVDTASGLAILSGQTRLKFGPPLRLLQAGVGRLLRKLGLLLFYLGQFHEVREFSLRGRRIRPAQWHSDYAVQVQLLAEDPEERNGRVALGNTLQGKLSRRRIAEEYYGVESWSEDLEEQLYEGLVLGDAMKRTLEEYVSLQKGGEQAQPDSGPDMGGLAGLQAQAANMRASRPWAPQMPGLPGSPEALAGQSQEMLMAGMPGGSTG